MDGTWLHVHRGGWNSCDHFRLLGRLGLLLFSLTHVGGVGTELRSVDAFFQRRSFRAWFIT